MHLEAPLALHTGNDAKKQKSSKPEQIQTIGPQRSHLDHPISVCLLQCSISGS